MPIVVDTAQIPAELSVEGLCVHMNATTPAVDSPAYDELERHLQAAVNIVDRRCGPLVAAERTVKVRESAGFVILPAGPITAVGSVLGPGGEVMDEDTDYELDVEAGVISVPRRRCGGQWTITLTLGYPDGDVPADLVLAVYIIATQLYGSQRPGGQSRRIPGGMGADPTEAPPLTGFAIPNRAIELMRDYRRPGVQ